MTIDELKQVVAKIQLGDSRQVDRLVLLEWQDNIGDLEFQDAIAAVTMHRKESMDYLQPSHVRVNARRAKDAREREARKMLPAPPPNKITLDRAEFERLTQEAAEAARREKSRRKIDPEDWS
jgi:hypothetical protein